MTLHELIDQLEDIAMVMQQDGIDPSTAEVKLALQPAWPMQYKIGNVVSVDGKVFIAEDGDGNEYLNSNASKELEW